MRAFIAASLFSLSLTDACGAAFYADQQVTATGQNAPPAPPAVIYNGDLPPDGRYAASVSYVGQASSPALTFTARGTSAIAVDLRAGTFDLSNDAIDSCYRSPVCFAPVFIGVGAPSSFAYSDTLSVHAPGASATTQNFVEFAFRMSDVVNYNTGVIASASESIVSSLSLVDASDSSLAASASIDRLCTSGSGCTGTPTTTATFDATQGTFAEAVASNGYLVPNPDDLLRVRVPVYGEYSILDLSLAMGLVDDSAAADIMSTLSLTASPGLIVSGTNGYLLQPRVVPEPAMPFFVFGGLWVLWSLARRDEAQRRHVPLRSIAC